MHNSSPAAACSHFIFVKTTNNTHDTKHYEKRDSSFIEWKTFQLEDLRFVIVLLWCSNSFRFENKIENLVQIIAGNQGDPSKHWKTVAHFQFGVLLWFFNMLPYCNWNSIVSRQLCLLYGKKCVLFLSTVCISISIWIDCNTSSIYKIDGKRQHSFIGVVSCTSMHFNRITGENHCIFRSMTKPWH